jgi:hypothetical protein
MNKHSLFSMKQFASPKLIPITAKHPLSTAIKVTCSLSRLVCTQVSLYDTRLKEGSGKKKKKSAEKILMYS